MGSSGNMGDRSKCLGVMGLVIRIVGVGSDGDVAADESVAVGLSGSTSSLFFGRRLDRKIFFRPARMRLGDLGDEGVELLISKLGGNNICGERGDAGT